MDELAKFFFSSYLEQFDVFNALAIDNMCKIWVSINSENFYFNMKLQVKLLP